MRNKGFIVVDPLKDSLINQILNDLSNDGPIVVYNYKEKPEKWIKASGKIGCKGKKLIQEKPPLLYPPSTSRTHKLGFITLPNDVNLEKQSFGKKIKYVFTRKIF